MLQALFDSIPSNILNGNAYSKPTLSNFMEHPPNTRNSFW
jgi:hypothetical protein